MPYNKGYRRDAVTTQDFKPGIHLGLDSYGPVGCPLYAPARSIALEVIRPGQASRAFGSASSGQYVALKVLGNHPRTLVVTVQKHMAPTMVAVEGKIYEEDDSGHIGYQGWSGTVDPPGPGGEHCHQDVFIVHAADGIEVKESDYGNLNDKRVDPAPYFTGGKSLVIDPMPEPVPVVEVAHLPFAAKYRYTDPDSLGLRDAPAGNRIGEIAPGSVLNFDLLAFADGMYWGHIANGWCSLGGERIWMEQILSEDLSGKVADLEAKLDTAIKARDAAATMAGRLNTVLDNVVKVANAR